jgi:hypothetical protein
MAAPLYDPDFVWVPVPRERVLEVMRFLGGRETHSVQTEFTSDEDRVTPAELESEPDDAGLSERWSDDELVDLVAHAHAKQLLVLQYLALHPDDVVTAAELRDYLLRHRDISGISARRSGRALGAVMGALRKRSAWYEHTMPFSGEWDPKRGENVYRLKEAEYAQPILAALAEHRPDEMGATE